VLYSPDLNSPIVAISIITIIAEIGVLDASVGCGWQRNGAQLNFVFFAACTMLVPLQQSRCSRSPSRIY